MQQDAKKSPAKNGINPQGSPPKTKATETTHLLPKPSKARAVHINTANNSSRSKSPAPDGSPLFFTDDYFDSDAEIEAYHAAAPRKSFQERFCNKKSLYLGAGLLVSIFLATANNLMFKRMLNRFIGANGHTLEFFVNQFTTVLFVVLSGSVLAYRWIFTDKITPEMLLFPKSKFAIMAVLDGSSSLLGTIGGATTAGQLQTLLNQSGIPVTMMMSYFVLGTQYVWKQYTGAALIVVGALLGLTPALMHLFVASENIAPTAKSTVQYYGVLIYMMGVIPGAYSGVYKEKNLKSERLDVYYLSTLVAVLQALFGFAFAPVLALPVFGGVSLAEIPQQMVDGWQCFMGEHVEGFSCDSPYGPSPRILMLSFTLVNFVYNLLLLKLTQEGSALLVVISSALSLPFTNVCFTLPFIMGEDAEELRFWDVCGLIVVVAGFLLYSLGGQKSKTGEGREFELPLPAVSARQTLFYPQVKLRRVRSVPAFYSPGSPRLGRSPKTHRTNKSSPNLSKVLIAPQ